MVNQKLVDWINNKLKEGHTAEQIKDLLIKENYDSDEINEVLKLVLESNQQKNTVVNSKKSINIWLVVIVGILILGIIISGIFVFGLNKDKPVSEIINTVSDNTVDLIDENDNNLGQMQVNIDVDMEVTTDNGYEDFKQKFRDCQPATSEYELLDTLIYFYEIIGPKDGLCEVKSKFIANPNPAWVNKEMICLLDNSLDYETSVQDMSKCSGELYNLMTDMISYN